MSTTTRKLAGLLVFFSFSACGIQEKSPMIFDQKYHQALQALTQGQNLVLIPCFPTVNERDYRFMHCFSILKGSGQSARKQMGEALEGAGFKTEAHPAQGSDLDATYRLPGSPYTVDISFLDWGVSWAGYQDHVGNIPPFRPQDMGAPYALLDPQDVARSFTSGLLKLAKAPLKGVSAVNVKTCGQSSLTAASVCVTWPSQKVALLGMVRDAFFGGRQDWFSAQESKGTYTYREEPLIAEMIQEGSLPKGYVSSLLLQKIGDQHYTVRDRTDWPAYQFELTGTSSASGSSVKITASRIPVPKKP